MQYFLLGIGLLVALVFFGRWFVDADPRQAAAAVKWGALGLIAAVLLLILFSGRLGLLLLLVPLALWLRNRYRRAAATFSPSAGQSSEVRTRFLQMTLDHDSGEMDGEILDGRHAGQFLSQLDLAALLELLQDYRNADPQSASVLEAYLDRVRTEDWRAAAGGGQGGSEAGSDSASGDGRAGTPRDRAGPMSRAEALEILGLEEGASTSEIREAHHRLMQKLHPDHGGSNYLAAKLNEAKDLLLRH
jgi:UPF0716 family protein affecting phage T7 exclusion